jgi:uncharacterized protein (TIGR02231 family)
VELTLTTAVPSADASPPVLGSQLLTFQTPVLQNVEELVVTTRSKGGQRALGAAMEMDMAVANVAAPAPPPPRVNQFAADYRVPGTVSVLSAREPRLFPLSAERFDVELMARVVPNRSNTAFALASFEYGAEATLQAGELQLYRDGAYVGTAATRAFLPGEKVSLPFGSDERVKVAVRADPAASRDTGVLGKQRVEETRQRFEITSYHTAPIRIEVLDRLPVPQNEDIRVAVLKDATEPSLRDVDGKPGVLQWNLDAKPRTTSTIKQYWSVTYPRDRILERIEN